MNWSYYYQDEKGIPSMHINFLDHVWKMSNDNLKEHLKIQ